MAWKGVTVMDQRIRFISEYLEGYFKIAEICRQFDISRKTGHKWIGRYKEYGVNGLEDRFRQAHYCPHKTEDATHLSIIELRKKHPTWGPKKLLVILRKRYPYREYPAISTTADILKREGLVQGKRRRFRREHPGCPKTVAKQPNEIWTADYKGHFRMRNGQYCYPLTVCDMYSRYLLGCEVHDAISLEKTKKYFKRLFSEHGLPDRIRTDNGIPFASSAIARLSTLSVWWISLGIYPELIEPGRPEQNGKHERMHRTLKKEATIPSERNIKGQQRRFDHFQEEYNELRPHEALKMNTPSAMYVRSKRRMPNRIKAYEYPAHFEVRLVSKNGGVRWGHKRVPVSHTLVKENIGFEEMDNGVYNVYYCTHLIGRFFEEIGRIKDIIKRVPTRARHTQNCNPCTQNKV